MSARTVEVVALAAIAVAVLFGGFSFVQNLVQFHGVSISVLGVLAIVVLYAFRRNYLAGGPQARIHATRDAAFLAAIAAAIAFVFAPARWSLGATIAGVEMALVVEMLSRFAPAR